MAFHCAAGKDRAGLVAALLLLALGVDRGTVMQDYLLSNEAYRRPLQLRAQARGKGLPEEALAVMWRVRPSFLNAALAAIDTECGGLDRYLARRLGLTTSARDDLADRLLEAPVD